MRKKMFSVKNIVMLFMTLALLTSVGCRKQDDGDKVTKDEVETLKAELQKKLTMLENDLKTAKAELSSLQGTEGVSQADIDKAKDAVIAATVAKATFEAYKKSNDDKVAKLETLVGTNKGTLEEALANLKKEFNGSLDQKIKEFQGKIDANKAELLKMLKGRYTNKQIDEKLKAMGLANNARLRSLVLLPDYVADKSGALPILNFSPLKTDNCGDIVPAVEVHYVVNPSTVTKEDIDTLNLSFRYNDPISLTARKNLKGVDQKAEFVSLKNGILTVKATVNTAKLWAAKANTENRIDELMLEVPAKDGESIVSSDWAKVVFEPLNLAIVKKPKSPKASTEPWKSFELKKYVKTGVGTNDNDKTVTEGVVVDDDNKNYSLVAMPYNQPLDLMKHVKAMYAELDNNSGDVTRLPSDITLDTYGLRFEFDLMNHETNKPIVYKLGPNNKTDQQKFIKLADDGHTVTTRVYGKDGNQAAVNRTPIVHVMLVSGEGADRCVARHGYIKLHITNAPTVDPIVKTGESVEATCDNPQEIYRIGTKEMNEEFYHAVNMEKIDFHNSYEFVQTPLLANDPTNVGTLEEVVDPDDTESYNLVYNISSDEAWANKGKTVWIEGVYTHKTTGHKIKVTIKVPITAPKVVLDIALDNYWYNKGSKDNANKEYVIHNVAVPEKGDADSAHATWINNIAAAFKTYNKQENDDVTVNTEDPHVNKLGLIELGFRQPKNKKKYNEYDYEFIFTDAQPASPVKGITLKVSPDNKELWASGNGITDEVVAKIHSQNAYDNDDTTNDGDPLEYMNGPLAKELLNKGPEAMKATLELVVTNTCDKKMDVVVKTLKRKNQFDVHFLRPVNVAENATENFVDAVDKGDKGSYIDMKKIADLSDWRKYKKETYLVGEKEDDYDFLPENPNYYGYYGVQNIKADIENITVSDLQVNGTDVKTLPNTIVIKQTDNGDVYNTVTYDFGRLIYENNGTNLDKEFTMHVPVVISYKWGDVKTTVDVMVKPTNKTARKAAK